ncbi:MAG: uracil-DNA glycosylase family protein [Rhodospirillales bacterium]|nr:uracil-DNA glycosylase family protein [Rhodospirillales bacterium]
MKDLDELLSRIKDCTLCAPHLPLGPRPIIRAKATAKILLIGQAPGTRVHESGVPWDDPSGDRLRQWLDVPKDVFYDESHIAIMPMGFCYPGRKDKGGDNPPRPECALEWHELVLKFVPDVKLTLLIGSYAQKYYLGKAMKKTMTETVRAWHEYLPRFLPTPHPSWRSTGWLNKNAWFESDLLPELRKRVRKVL